MILVQFRVVFENWLAAILVVGELVLLDKF